MPTHDPSLVTHPEARWTPVGVQSINSTWKVTPPSGGPPLFAKRSRPDADPAEIPGEHAAHQVMGLLRLPHALPSTVVPVRGEPHLVLPHLPDAPRLFEAENRGRDFIRPALSDHRGITDILTAEWLTHAADRHFGNYLVHAGHVVPIDYGFTWKTNDVGDPVGPEHSALLESARDHADYPALRAPLNKDFLARILQERHGVRHALESIVHPFLTPSERYEASGLLDEKLAHVRELLNHPAPSLGHLISYQGDSRVNPLAQTPRG